MNTAGITIVVLNWNRRDDTLGCLASLGRAELGAAPGHRRIQIGHLLLPQGGPDLLCLGGRSGRGVNDQPARQQGRRLLPE